MTKFQKSKKKKKILKNFKINVLRLFHIFIID